MAAQRGLSHLLSHPFAGFRFMAAGKGSIRLKRAPDYWEVRAFAGRDPVTGTKRYVSRSVRGRKRDAQRLLTRLSNELDTHGPTSRRTVDELLTAHVGHLESRGRQARTIEGYRSITRAIANDSTFGKTQLDKLTVKAIDGFYNRLGRQRGLAPASVQRYHALLRSAFKQAMAWGWTTRNPVLLATPPSVPRIGRKIPPPDVVAQLLEKAARSRNPENVVAFRLLPATGARRGEVCGLHCDSVDLATGRVEIRAAMAQLMTGEVFEKDPKSHQIREVTIDEGTRALLVDHLEQQRRTALRLGSTLSNRAYVLAGLSVDGEGLAPTHPNWLTQAFGRLRRKVPGAENLRLHDLRHWYASTQLDAGEATHVRAAPNAFSVVHQRTLRHSPESRHIWRFRGNLQSAHARPST